MELLVSHLVNAAFWVTITLLVKCNGLHSSNIFSRNLWVSINRGRKTAYAHGRPISAEKFWFMDQYKEK